MNKVDLKPCPFCGGTQAYCTSEQFTADSGAVVRCPDCGAITREYAPHHWAESAWNAGLVFAAERGYRATCAHVVIVSRHAGAIEWLQSHGITGEVIAHVTDPAQIAGKTVIGALPLHLAAQAFAVVAIDMPNLPAEKRGQDLTPDEMDEFGACLSVYHVTRG